MLAAKAITADGPPKTSSTALVAEGGDPAAIVAEEGLGTLGDADELVGIVAAAIAANADAADRIRGGNEKAIGPIIGFVMRETKGRADGGEVTRIAARAAGRIAHRDAFDRRSVGRCRSLDIRPRRKRPARATMLP